MSVSVGDKITVKMYSGIKQGVVNEIIHNYGFGGMGQETKYKISGDGFVTMCSERLINATSDENLFSADNESAGESKPNT